MAIKVCFLIEYLLTVLGIPRGLGRHVQTFGPHVQEDWAIGLFTAELTYTGVIVFVKFSILALYWRIFHKSSGIKLPVAIMSGIVGAWGISVVSFPTCTTSSQGNF